MWGRLWRTSLAALAVAIVTAIAGGVPAHATTVAPLTIEQMADGATWIVEGTITEVWTEIDAETGSVWTRATLDVSDVLKGPYDASALVIDSLGGTSGAVTTTMSGRAQYSEGEEIFVFLDVVRGDRLVPVAKAMGKYIVRRAPGETRKYVMTWGGEDAYMPYDARFLPHPAPESRLYLDDLRSRVVARLSQPWDGAALPGIDHARLAEINAPGRRLR